MTQLDSCSRPAAELPKRIQQGATQVGPIRAQWPQTCSSSPKRIEPEQGIEVVSGVAIARRHEAPVDVERRRGAGMPEPIRDRAKVDASGKELGGNEVAKVVEPDVAETDLLAEPSPTPCDCVGSPRSFAQWVNREDEFGLFEIASAVAAVRAACALRSASASTACVVSDTTRGLPALVDLMTTPALDVAETDRSMRTKRSSRSTSHHLSAHISSRRAPLAIATSSQHHSSMPTLREAASAVRTSSTPGGVIVTLATRAAWHWRPDCGRATPNARPEQQYGAGPHGRI
jgi:hypothetical protein